MASVFLKLKYCFVLVGFLFVGQVDGQCNGGNPDTNYVKYNFSQSIEFNFNNARRWEESNRGLPNNCLGNLNPPAGGWNSMTEIEKALYIIQDERTARGFLPFQGMEVNLNAISQAHSEWMLANDKFSHTGDPSLGTGGSDSGDDCHSAFVGSHYTQRINSSVEVSGCWEIAGTRENIGIIAGNRELSGSIIYGMMYVDHDCCSWGHRIAFLYPFSNNFGSNNHEGLIGIGVAEQAGYLWPKFQNEICRTYFVKAITFKLYDPQANPSCSFDLYQSGDCPEVLTLSGNIASGTHDAQSIDLSGIVSPSTNVSIIGEDEIYILNSNEFESMSGAELIMDISPCSNSFRSIPSSLKSNDTQPHLILLGNPISTQGTY